jgi:hypothetical protein
MVSWLYYRNKTKLFSKRRIHVQIQGLKLIMFVSVKKGITPKEKI